MDFAQAFSQRMSAYLVFTGIQAFLYFLITKKNKWDPERQLTAVIVIPGLFGLIFPIWILPVRPHFITIVIVIFGTMLALFLGLGITTIRSQIKYIAIMFKLRIGLYASALLWILLFGPLGFPFYKDFDPPYSALEAIIYLSVLLILDLIFLKIIYLLSNKAN